VNWNRRLTLQLYIAFAGLLNPGDQAHKCAFASTVVTHDSRMLTVLQYEIGIGQGAYPP
jgi:hypothetical protein